jgi:hypothetical protein
MRRPRRAGTAVALPMLVATLALLATAPPTRADAQGLRWRLVAPESPPDLGACMGEGAPGCSAPIELGRVGDIEFAQPNRGLLVTAGNGATVGPGIWEYDGSSWHELASVCGASDGRIAWAGTQEFWTVSDGRPGQAANQQGLLPPLEDNTLCHFAPNPASGALEVVRSYAAPAFQASSYQAMQAAACLTPEDCWFGGASLPAPEPGVFGLHWNGSALEAAPNIRAHAVEDIRAFAGRLIESTSLPAEEVLGEDEEPLEILHPYVLYEISTVAGELTFEGLRPFAAGHVPLPEYPVDSFPAALAGMRLAVAAGPEGETLWAAAGPASSPPAGSQPGTLTLLHDLDGSWSQVLPSPSPSSPGGIEEDLVTSIAAEPESSSVWLALDTQTDASNPSPSALATVLHVQADGSSTEEQLPSPAERAEGVAPQGAAAEIACPAPNDCWLATTRGVLFHLSEEATQTLPLDDDPALTGPPVNYRPPDEGLPQVQPSGLSNAELEEAQPPATLPNVPLPASEAVRVTVPAYSHARLRLLHGDVLVLSFRLPVKARVRLMAKRNGAIVESTSTRTFARGDRELRLHLDPERWPTKLVLHVLPLAPLPTVSVREGLNTITTSLVAPPRASTLLGAGLALPGPAF